jgi:sulfur relay (sulfurtransferase) DsrC/TusE family protein
MSFCDSKNMGYFRGILRPRLRVNREQVEREAGYKDPDRVDWLIRHKYLCSGGLDKLKHHPDWDVPLSDTIARYAENPKKSHHYSMPKLLRRFRDSWESRPHKSIKVSVRMTGDVTKDKKELEKLMKLALHERSCNAGVEYREYTRRKYLFGRPFPRFSIRWPSAYEINRVGFA